MSDHPKRGQRRSIRLKGYDYTQSGAYFVTICTHGRACVFGEVLDGAVRLSKYGQIAHEEWRRTAVVRPYVILDAWVVMPNHVHGLIVITDKESSGDHKTGGAVGEAFGKPVAGSLSTIVRSYKAATTRRINALRDTSGLKVWQGRFYEHIVRDDGDLARIREYIVNNPARWADDRYYSG